MLEVVLYLTLYLGACSLVLEVVKDDFECKAADQSFGVERGERE